MSKIRIRVNGREIAVTESTTVSAAVALCGVASFRKSVSGGERGPLCGMGVCFECRVTVDGRPHTRSCQTLCRQGMEVVTDAF